MNTHATMNLSDGTHSRRMPVLWMGVVVFALAAVPVTANAQVSIDPGSAAGPEPAPEPPAPPPPTQIIVTPDGQVVSPEGDEAATGVVHYEEGLVPGSDLDVDDGPGLSPQVRGPVPEVHVVREGDTLWGISTQYFQSPWEWPRVWSFNPSITNPHWIYPADIVRLRVAEGRAGLPIEPPAASGGTEEPVDVAGPIAAPRRGVSLRRIAFVDFELAEQAMTVVGSVSERTVLGAGDHVYLKSGKDAEPLKPGTNYTIYSDIQQLKHPVTGKELGAFVTVHGHIKVASALPNKRARAVITASYKEIARGEHVGPVKRVFNAVDPVQNSANAEGIIVEKIGMDQLIGADQLVFLDLGTESGLVPGNTLFVVRRGDAYQRVMGPQSQVGQNDTDYPARSIGRLLVVEVGERASVAMVMSSVAEIGIGDHVILQK